MAQWKKIIVSGSIAELASVSASEALLVGSNQIITTDPGTTLLSGSFSGSFFGNAAGLKLDINNDGDNRVTTADGDGTLTAETNFTFDGSLLNVTGDVSASGGVNVGGNLAVDGGSITSTAATVNVFNTTPSTINLGSNADTINIGSATSNVTLGKDLTVTGDLFVQGDTTNVNTANLYVEDKFILLNSGSANPDEAGLIVDEGASAGHAFVYDSNTARWAFTGSLASNATSVAPDAFAAAVVDENVVESTDKAEYQKRGNIKVDTNNDIWIYV